MLKDPQQFLAYSDTNNFKIHMRIYMSFRLKIYLFLWTVIKI